MEIELRLQIFNRPSRGKDPVLALEAIDEPKVWQANGALIDIRMSASGYTSLSSFFIVPSNFASMGLYG